MRNDIRSSQETSSLNYSEITNIYIQDNKETVTFYTKSKIRFLHKHYLTLNIPDGSILRYNLYLLRITKKSHL